MSKEPTQFLPLKKIYFLLCLFFIGGHASGIAQDHKQSADQLLSSAVDNKEVVGIAAGYSVGGEIMWQGSAGYSNLEEKVVFAPETLSRIASISKPLTAVAILQLYEAGKLDLNASVQQYIEDFPEKKQGAITIRQLLNHSSGVDAYKNKKEQESKVHYKNLAEAMEVFADRDLVAVPGEAFHYTTYGYVILGRVIEEVTGMEYEAYMHAHIFEPLGMQHTAVEHHGQQYPGKASLYHRNEKGKITEADHHDLSNRVPGGGFYSNVSDMLRFGDAIMDYTLISEETTRLMFTDAGVKKQGNGYGLGWYLFGENPSYGLVYGHNGAQTGASAFLMILPQQNTSVVVLSNTSGAMQAVSNITVSLFDQAAASQN